MTVVADLPDYATMRRAIRRIHDTDFLVGLSCPRSECDGALRRERGRLVCNGCSRDVQLGRGEPDSDAA